ncbi:MAG: VWA domain-containing protein, partial [bacterium]|nr:VWA domain-containing protein [bacterium]
MEFGTPQALWLFIVIPFFVMLHYMSFSDLGRFQRGLSLFLRILLIAFLILALADTRLIQKSDKLSVFFLLDGSRSMGQGSMDPMLGYIHEAAQNINEKSDQAGVISFGRDAFVEAGLGTDLEGVQDVQSDIQPDFTNLSGAIDLALASFPTDTGARIVVLSDGNENLGDSLTSARIATNRNVEIDVVPFGEPTTGEVTAGRLILPRRVEENEVFDVRAVIEAESETDATVEVYENENLIGTQDVHLVPGKNVFTFPRQQTEGGFVSYRVQVRAEGDVEGANNQATDYTIVEGQPRVCYVSGDPMEQPNLVNALQQEGIQADYRDLSGLPTSLISMAPYDVIIFSDVGAELLSPETMQAYQSYVRDLGGGFAMIGGENSFGPGGYFETPFEEMLPVDFDLTRKEYIPSIAIMLVIDSSGSMAGMEPSGEIEVELAKQACRLVVDLLQPNDQFGVVTFQSVGKWVVPFGELGNKQGAIDQIGTIRGGGGTSMYTGMAPAFEALRTADAKIKHMIVLSDGQTEPGDFDGIVNQMNQNDITLSAVGIGSYANEELLERLTERGGGNYYHCVDSRSIPQIFTKETFMAGNRALVEESFQAVPNQPSPITDGIDMATSPPLLGYVSTNIKPLATEALQTHRNDPLLAHWQYGLGRSLAFTSDTKAHWAARWLNWPGYKQMWTQAARWLVGGTMPGNLVPNIYFRSGKAYVSVDAIDRDGEMITDAVIKANVAFPEGDISELDLFQVAPGRYEASVDATQIGSYFVNIYQEDGEGNMIDQVS